MGKFSGSDLELFQNADEQVFVKIVAEYFPGMKYFAGRLTNETNANHIILAAFAMLYGCRRSIDSFDSLRLFLYKTVFSLLWDRKNENADGQDVREYFFREVIRSECLRM